jgi:hypothetical protein
MKTPLLLFAGLLILGTFTITGCSKDEAMDSEHLEPLLTNMKGWELYSWPYGTDWNYSILPGTNRLKSYNEVISVPIFDLESLKESLDKLRENEKISWRGREWLKSCWMTGYHDLCLPDEKTIEEVRKHCEKRKLELWVVP